jgi:hypothetical protein
VLKGKIMLRKRILISLIGISTLLMYVTIIGVTSAQEPFPEPSYDERLATAVAGTLTAAAVQPTPYSEAQFQAALNATLAAHTRQAPGCGTVPGSDARTALPDARTALPGGSNSGGSHSGGSDGTPLPLCSDNTAGGCQSCHWRHQFRAARYYL